MLPVFFYKVLHYTPSHDKNRFSMNNGKNRNLGTWNPVIKRTSSHSLSLRFCFEIPALKISTEFLELVLVSYWLCKLLNDSALVWQNFRFAMTTKPNSRKFHLELHEFPFCHDHNAKFSQVHLKLYEIPRISFKGFCPLLLNVISLENLHLFFFWHCLPLWNPD